MNLREFESSRAEFEENKVSTITRLQQDAAKESGIGLLPEHCSYFKGKYRFFVAINFFLKCMYSDANICISGKLL